MPGGVGGVAPRGVPLSRSMVFMRPNSRVLAGGKPQHLDRGFITARWLSESYFPGQIGQWAAQNLGQVVILKGHSDHIIALDTVKRTIWICRGRWNKRVRVWGCIPSTQILF